MSNVIDLRQHLAQRAERQFERMCQEDEANLARLRRELDRLRQIQRQRRS